MKRIIIAILCMMVCVVVKAQKNPDTYRVDYYGAGFIYNKQPSELNIKGKIRSVTYSIYPVNVRFGEPELGERVGYDYYVYNDNGQLIERFIKGDWRHTDLKNTISYDSDGNMSYVSYFTDQSKPTKYLYNEDGKLSRVEYGNYVHRLFYTNGILTKLVTYNRYEGDEVATNYFQNGRLSRRVQYNKTYNYEYNSKNLLIRDNHWGVTYKYNEKNLVSEIKEGTDTEDYEYKYDERGNWIKCVSLCKHSDGSIYKTYLLLREIVYID